MTRRTAEYGAFVTGTADCASHWATAAEVVDAAIRHTRTNLCIVRPHWANDPLGDPMRITEYSARVRVVSRVHCSRPRSGQIHLIRVSQSGKVEVLVVR